MSAQNMLVAQNGVYAPIYQREILNYSTQAFVLVFSSTRFQINLWFKIIHHYTIKVYQPSMLTHPTAFPHIWSLATRDIQVNGVTINMIEH